VRLEKEKRWVRSGDKKGTLYLFRGRVDFIPRDIVGGYGTFYIYSECIYEPRIPFSFTPKRKTFIKFWKEHDWVFDET